MSRPQTRRPRLALLGVLTALVALALSPTAHAAFSSTPAPGLVADGSVDAFAVSGENVYLGGSFNEIGPRTGSGVVFDSALSELQPGLPAVGGVDAAVDAVVPDGEGGWYVGGRFSDVGGVSRTNLAHILADGSVDPNFDPDPKSQQANAAVERLALSGSTLYVAGQFEQIGGQERRYLAAVSTATGLATSFAPEPNGEISCGLAVDGDYVFVCGYFSEVGGQELGHDLAALNATTGSATAWNPGNEGRPEAMYLSPSNVLYLAIYGKFSADPAQTEYEGLAALQIAAEPDQPPTFLPWHPNIGEVKAITQIGQTLYAGGHFNQVAYAPADRETENYTTYGRSNTAAFDVEKNYELLPFEARVEGNEYYVNVSSLVGAGGQLYLGGYFTGVGGEPRTDLSAVDPTTGAPTGADPDIDGSVNAIAASGSEVYVGGSITTVDGKPRAHLAVIDIATGALEENTPTVDGTVDALAVDSSTLYVGGSFRNATGAGETQQGRSKLAAFSTADGALEPFAPEANNTVKALAIAGETLYAGGEFGELEGKPHGDLAAFSTASGKLQESFNPQPNGVVNALAVESERLYAAGSFSELDGTARSDLAAFSTATGALDQSFDPPSFDRSLYAVAATASSVYVGGDFSEVGGAYRPRLVALSTSDGSLQAWNPEVSDNVDALLLDGSTLYAGGSFQDAGGLERSDLVGLSTATGVATHFEPEPDLEVKALALTPGGLYVGGNFQDIGGIPQAHLAELPATESPEVEETRAEQEALERERSERQRGGSGSGEGSASEGSDAGSTGLTSTPSTSITGGPPYFTSATTVTFTFTSDVEGASFRCSLDGSTPVSCKSPYTIGSLSSGVHRFVVQAVSLGGAVDTAGAAESFVVVATTTASPADTGPVLTRVKWPARIVRGRTAAKKKHKRSKRATVTFSLSEAATIRISLQRVEHSSCRKHRACTRVISAGTITLDARAGTNRVRFSGSVDGEPLHAGLYRATIVASDAAAVSSKPVTVRFRLLARGHPQRR